MKNRARESSQEGVRYMMASRPAVLHLIGMGCGSLDLVALDGMQRTVGGSAERTDSTRQGPQQMNGGGLASARGQWDTCDANGLSARERRVMDNGQMAGSWGLGRIGYLVMAWHTRSTVGLPLCAGQ